MKTSHLLPLFALTVLALGLGVARVKAAEPTTPAPAAPALDKVTRNILNDLKLTDAASEAKVRDILTAHFPALKAWHTEHDPKLKALWAQFDQARAAKDTPGADAALAEIGTVYATFKPQHDAFLAQLGTVLTPAQIERVQDVLTIDKVKVTYDAYLTIFPVLTAEQKAVVLRHLKAARAEAIDAGNMTEKSAFFKKYKIKIEEGYFAAQGLDAQKFRREFAAKNKAEAAAKKVAPPASLKVDFSIAGRADSVAPGWEQWTVPGGTSATRTFGRVIATVRAVQPAGASLAVTWWKGGAVDGAKMSVDALTVEGTEAQLELRLAGLTPGPHTLATFHNLSGGDNTRTPGPIVISVDGQQQVADLVPSRRAASDYDAASAYLRFDARAGTDVVIVFRAGPATPPATAGVRLCGFELDGTDPARRAAKPTPADGEEHADADTGTLTLAWAPAPTAVSHRVYFGQNRAVVAAATPSAPEFHGDTAAPSRAVSALSSLSEYFWRVDEVDAQGVVTTGETWRFRPRHLAFPGAEGYGRFASGGRGGRVLEVTNLNDSGPGSLRAAVEAEGPRTVVFAVSGLITLESKLVINHPYLTVAGQTAPGKGITLRKYNFGMMGAHDAIVRFVRVRPGNISGTTLDGMGMAASDHCIADHCSISWTIDESFSSRAARNITLQRTLIAEALNEAGHKKYPPGSRHGYAGSISGLIGSFHHNLLAHNSGRNWSLAGGLDQTGHHTGWLDIRNNVVYNWDNRTTDGGAAKVDYVNNYYKPGPASHVFHLLKPERNNIQGFGPQEYYVAGNIMEGHVAADNAWGGIVEPNPAAAGKSGDRVVEHDDARPSRFEPLASFVKDRPFFDSYVTTQPAAAAYKLVLSDVGCNQPALDDHDARVIGETLAKTFTYRGSKTGFPGLPDSQEDVGGWENYPEEHRAAAWDTDHDGLPDWWETLHGLNPNSLAGDFADANADPDGDGYTNLDDYLAWMAQPHLECRAGATVELDLSRLTRGFTDKPVHAVSAATNGKVALLADGKTARFTPATGFAGLASFTFTVTDAANDNMSQAVGVLVR